jgi:acetoin utilization protein AcuC
MWEASRLYASASQFAAELVLSGQVKSAFSPSGGLHHAFVGRASGFCILNDNALAAHVALARGMKVAYVDIDAHHGDGTQSIFYSNPDVLTVSIHETGRTLFPGTGFPSEIGDGHGVGYSINVPMAPFSTDHHYQFAFDQVIEPIVRAYDADFLVFQVGADAHWQDPLAHLELTSQGWMGLFKRLIALAGDKPFVVLGGGGYTIETAARLWTMVQAELVGRTLPNEVPEQIAQQYGIQTLHDTSAPSRSDQEDETAWDYVRSSVESLLSLVDGYYSL